MEISTEQYISVVKYAEKVGEFPALIHHYIKDGRIPAVKFDGRWYIPKTALESWPPPKHKLGRPTKPEGETHDGKTRR